MQFKIINDLPINEVTNLKKGQYVDMPKSTIDYIYKQRKKASYISFTLLTFSKDNFPNKTYTINGDINQNWVDTYLLQDDMPKTEKQLILKKMATLGDIVLGKGDSVIGEIKWPYKKKL